MYAQPSYNFIMGLWLYCPGSIVSRKPMSNIDVHHFTIGVLSSRHDKPQMKEGNAESHQQELVDSSHHSSHWLN